MEKYRCKGCGYFHIGPAPEHCPVCGAPRTSFVEYAGPGDLTGTKTFENLQTALTGESRANRSYMLWARIARLEGANDAAAAFERAAAEETAHALGQIAYMGAYGSTRANLGAAAAGEEYETGTMYPEFAEQAEADGHPEVAMYFRSLGRYEAAHRDEYRKALEDLGD